MKDIYDIKPLESLFPINIVYSLIFVFFIIFLYLIYYILNKDFNKKQETFNKINFERKISREEFFTVINKFEEKYLSKNSEIFYSKLIEILKEILKQKTKKDISKLTFNEINKLNLDKNLTNLIKNIYFKEYAKNIEDSEEVRKELVERVREVI